MAENANMEVLSNQFLAWLKSEIRENEWHLKSLENMVESTKNRIDMLKTMQLDKIAQHKRIIEDNNVS